MMVLMILTEPRHSVPALLRLVGRRGRPDGPRPDRHHHGVSEHGAHDCTQDQDRGHRGARCHRAARRGRPPCRWPSHASVCARVGSSPVLRGRAPESWHRQSRHQMLPMRPASRRVARSAKYSCRRLCRRGLRLRVTAQHRLVALADGVRGSVVMVCTSSSLPCGCRQRRCVSLARGRSRGRR